MDNNYNGDNGSSNANRVSLEKDSTYAGQPGANPDMETRIREAVRITGTAGRDRIPVTGTGIRGIPMDRGSTSIPLRAAMSRKWKCRLRWVNGW